MIDMQAISLHTLATALALAVVATLAGQVKAGGAIVNCSSRLVGLPAPPRCRRISLPSDDRDFRGQGSLPEKLTPEGAQGEPYTNDDFDETSGPELTADEEALLQEMPT
jgi:hypothetical protein